MIIKGNLHRYLNSSFLSWLQKSSVITNPLICSNYKCASLCTNQKYHSIEQRGLVLHKKKLAHYDVQIGPTYFSKECHSTAGNRLDFSNHGLVFRHKSYWELLRGLIVLHVCGIETLVKHSYKLLRAGERVLGSWLLGKVVSPFYWQFVAGDTESEMANAASKLRELNINLMIAPMIETDLGEGYDQDVQYEKNKEKTLHLVEVCGRQGKTKYLPICQTKHTAHLSADVLSRISIAYENLSPQNRMDVIKNLSRAIQASGAQTSVNLDLLNLVEADKRVFMESLPRFREIGEKCLHMRVTLAVDAEYTYTNPAISFITLAMMDCFNHTRPVVWNTYQALLKSTPEWLKHDLHIADAMNFKFGAKIVRGAYLDKERQRALELNYSDPTNPNYQATSKAYDGLIDYLGSKVSSTPGKYNLMVATHNEASVRKAVDLLESLSPTPLQGEFVFAQVYGMAENISVPLAAAAYQVYKSIPYGNMDEVLPYLSRRASENRAVFKGVRRERTLLSQQLLSRMSLR